MRAILTDEQANECIYHDIYYNHNAAKAKDKAILLIIIKALLFNIVTVA